MTHRSPKQRTYRQRVDNEWVAVHLSKADKEIWNVGVSIVKSKRAQNDWYRSKKNRRAEKAEAYKRKRGMKPMMVMYRLLKKALKDLPKGHSLVAWLSSPKNETLTLYARRLGFHPYPTDDGGFLWVLVTQ